MDWIAFTALYMHVGSSFILAAIVYLVSDWVPMHLTIFVDKPSVRDLPRDDVSQLLMKHRVHQNQIILTSQLSSSSPLPLVYRDPYPNIPMFVLNWWYPEPVCVLNSPSAKRMSFFSTALISN